MEPPIYSGIGEIHLHFEGTAAEPIVRKTGRQAVARNLYLHVPTNAAEVRGNRGRRIGGAYKIITF